MRLNLIIFIFFIFNFSNNVFANIQIIAKVENKIITSFELKNKILGTLILANLEINQKNIDQIKKSSLELLVQQKLKIIELDKFEVKIEEEKVNQYLSSIYSDSLVNLANKFENNNLSFDLLKKEIETQLRWQRLIYSIYSKNIKIDESTIDKEIEYLRVNNLNFQEFNISEITIPKTNNEKDKIEIKKIEQEIKDYGFENAVTKFSIASSSYSKGNLGWIPAKSLSSEIYNAINKINVGEITQPIIKSENILFFKLNDRRNSKTTNENIQKLRTELINKKKNELFNMYSNSHISKIKNLSLIEYK